MAKLVTARQLRWFGFGFPFDPFLHVSTWPCYSMHLQFKSHLSMFADTQIVTKEPTEKTGPSTAQALILLYSSTHVFWALPGLQYCTHNLRFGAFQIGFSITIQLKRATPHDILGTPRGTPTFRLPLWGIPTENCTTAQIFDAVGALQCYCHVQRWKWTKWRAGIRTKPFCGFWNCKNMFVPTNRFHVFEYVSRNIGFMCFKP